MDVSPEEVNEACKLFRQMLAQWDDDPRLIRLRSKWDQLEALMRDHPEMRVELRAMGFDV
jgi:hypothetical protein